MLKLSKISGAHILAIEYRLAPQQPFPAALCDVLASYLYLINPPNDARFKPYKPEQIVIFGDNAGGGLAISLGLVLRDLGLSPPAGIISWVSFYTTKKEKKFFLLDIINIFFSFDLYFFFFFFFFFFFIFLFLF